MRHRQNADGGFWVNQNACCACKSCFVEAPSNIRFDETVGMSFVFKQPETEEELNQMREAIRFCPVEAIEES
jgi:ferredoxin